MIGILQDRQVIRISFDLLVFWLRRKTNPVIDRRILSGSGHHATAPAAPTNDDDDVDDDVDYDDSYNDDKSMTNAAH